VITTTKSGNPIPKDNRSWSCIGPSALQARQISLRQVVQDSYGLRYLRALGDSLECLRRYLMQTTVLYGANRQIVRPVRRMLTPTGWHQGEYMNIAPVRGGSREDKTTKEGEIAKLHNCVNTRQHDNMIECD